jgi:hypothetical protein
MNLKIWFVRLVAIGIELLAFAYLLFPQQMVGLLGITLSTPSAIGDVRATYGGLGIATAICLWLVATPEHVQSLGLRMTLFIALGLLLARGASMLIDGQPNTVALVLLALEIAIAAGSVVVMRIGSAAPQGTTVRASA